MARSPRPDPPRWIIPDPYVDEDLGILKSGKEGQINLLERRSLVDDATPILLAQKRYVPRQVTAKGTLEALGVERASAFRNDVAYREGRQFRKSRDRRAVEQMSTYGKHLMQDRWMHHEHDVMRTLWHAGVNVPYPMSYGDDVFVMEYVGERSGAAPMLASARLSGAELDDALMQVLEGLTAIVDAGWIHGDLSAFNLLWWEGAIWFIDFPQAIDLAANPQGLNFLHRDVTNIAAWFNQRGLATDPDELFAGLL